MYVNMIIWTKSVHVFAYAQKAKNDNLWKTLVNQQAVDNLHRRVAYRLCANFYFIIVTNSAK